MHVVTTILCSSDWALGSVVRYCAAASVCLVSGGHALSSFSSGTRAERETRGATSTSGLADPLPFFELALQRSFPGWRTVARCTVKPLPRHCNPPPLATGVLAALLSRASAIFFFPYPLTRTAPYPARPPSLFTSTKHSLHKHVCSCLMIEIDAKISENNDREHYLEGRTATIHRSRLDSRLCNPYSDKNSVGRSNYILRCLMQFSPSGRMTHVKFQT